MAKKLCRDRYMQIAGVLNSFNIARVKASFEFVVETKIYLQMNLLQK